MIAYIIGHGWLLHTRFNYPSRPQTMAKHVFTVLGFNQTCSLAYGGATTAYLPCGVSGCPTTQGSLAVWMCVVFVAVAVPCLSLLGWMEGLGPLRLFGAPLNYNNNNNLHLLLVCCGPQQHSQFRIQLFLARAPLYSPCTPPSQPWSGCWCFKDWPGWLDSSVWLTSVLRPVSISGNMGDPKGGTTFMTKKW